MQTKTCANCGEELVIPEDEEVRDKIRCSNCGYWGEPAKQCPRCFRGTLAICHVEGKAVMGCDECKYYEEIEEELAIIAGQSYPH